MFIVYSYFVYLAISLTVTVWVAKTLHKRGRIFLVDAFHGQQELADSINHLLVVGFYLINVGYVAFALKSTREPKQPAPGHRTGERQVRFGTASSGRNALL